MKSLLMASVAAASLFAVTGAALAQGTNQGGTSSPAPAQKSDTGPAAAPASKGSDTQSSAPPTTSKSGAANEEKGAPKSRPQQAQDKAKAQPDNAANDMKSDSKSTAPATSKSGTTADEKGAPKSTPQKAQEKAKAEPDKAANDEKSDSKSNATTTNLAASPTAKDTKAAPTADTKPSTTGAAAAGSTGAGAAPPAEKRTQIVSAIKQEKVQEVKDVNFNISIGTTVPSTVRYYPLPSRIVEIYPEWSGYDFILVRGQYIILRPRTHEIVYIIEG